MIVFDIQCDDGHIFEGWFADSATYEKQVKTHAVECPVCGSSKVKKAPMAPNIATGVASRVSEAETPPAPQGSENSEASGASEGKEQTARYMKMLTKMREHVEANCDYVGDKFAEEARRIHYGETEKHNIYGEASSEETKELEDEGIEFRRDPVAATTELVGLSCSSRGTHLLGFCREHQIIDVGVAAGAPAVGNNVVGNAGHIAKTKPGSTQLSRELRRANEFIPLMGAAR